jgi:hypothetical protein
VVVPARNHGVISCNKWRGVSVFRRHWKCLFYYLTWCCINTRHCMLIVPLYHYPTINVVLSLVNALHLNVATDCKMLNCNAVARAWREYMLLWSIYVFTNLKHWKNNRTKAPGVSGNVNIS